MTNVVNLAERRAAEFEGDPPAICVCGCQAFVLRSDHERVPEGGIVHLRRDGSVSGYAGAPHCVRCGTPYPR